MELNHEFRVTEPPEQVWEVMTDVPAIAPCMPGAELQEVVGDEFHGVVKVKLGPITAQYKGTARFVERDDDARRAVLRAEGRETRGQGNAKATVTAQLEPDGEGTRVSVATDLMITGRVAQFGRGVLADVSSNLLDQFVACLERKLAGEQPGAGEGGATGAAPASAQPEPGEPVDLLGAAGVPVAKRILPIVLVAAGLWLLRVLFRRRRAHRQG
jgi:carbon monoxide dehydrogenase subunit G